MIGAAHGSALPSCPRRAAQSPRGWWGRSRRGAPVTNRPQRGAWSRADDPPRCQPPGGPSRRGVGKDAKNSGKARLLMFAGVPSVFALPETYGKTRPRQRVSRAAAPAFGRDAEAGG